MKYIFKKFVLYMLVLVNCAVCMGLVFPLSAGASEFYTEADKAEFNETVGLLKSLGILEQTSDTKMATTVTNDRFLQLAAGVINGPTSTGFYKDVFKEMSDMLDAPENEVTFDNIARVLVKGMNYDLYGEDSGFMQKAVRIGFFDGVQMGEKQHATYADVMKIFNNALNTTTVKISANGNEIEDGDILLYKAHKTEEFNGIVTATNVTGILGNEKVHEGNIKIDTEIYEIETDITALLGKAVKYYVRDEVVVYICERESLNNKITIDAEDIVSFADNTYTYYEGNNDKNAKLETPFTAIINGIATTVADLSAYEPKNGYIELLDNDNNKKYDVLYINSYEIFKVSVADTIDEVLYLKNADKQETLKLTEYKNYQVKSTGGGNMKLVDLAAGDIVLVYKADTKENIEIRKVVEYQEGIIRTISDNKITIDDETYRTADNYFAESKIMAGIPVNFAVVGGRIVSIKGNAGTEDLLAVLVKAVYNEDDDLLTVKLFDEKGRMLTVCCTEKLVFNGKKVLVSDVAAQIKPNKHMLFKYKLNDNGNLAKITTCPNYSTTVDYRTLSYDDAEIKLLYSSTLQQEGGLAFERYLNSIGGLFAFDSSTVVFEVPSATATDVEDSDYKVATKGSTNMTGMETISGDFYATTENLNLANVMVLTSKAISSFEHFIGVVKAIYEKLDENGDVRTFVEFQGPPGKTFNVYRSDSGLLRPYRDDSSEAKWEMTVGDMVHCKKTGDEATFNMVYDLETDYLAPADVGKEYGGFHHYILGRAYSRWGNQIRFTKTRTYITGPVALKDTEVYDISQFGIMKIYNNGKKIVVESSSDNKNRIVDYMSDPKNASKVFVYSNEGYPWMMYLYEIEE